jgi:hypothetical protein
MNVGVYCAAGPNPVFLRLFMLQLARQTQLPNFLSIYENGAPQSAFSWACGDIAKDLERRGVKVLHQHSSAKEAEIRWYFNPLQTLQHNTETDTFLKMDLDDFYADEYVANMSSALGAHDIAINQNNAITLVRPFHGDFKYKPSVQMKYSPIGAAPTHVAFNRKFSAKYLGFLAGFGNRADVADDDIMASAMEGMDVFRFDGPVDYTYVSHGNNHSSYAWQATGGRIYLD